MSEDSKNECVACNKTFKTPTALKTHNTITHKGEIATLLSAPEVVALPEAKKTKYIEINILPVEGELDSVTVRVSGKGTINRTDQIQRGKWVKVHEQVVEVLRNSVVNTFTCVADPLRPGQLIKKPHTYSKYPMSTREVLAA